MLLSFTLLYSYFFISLCDDCILVTEFILTKSRRGAVILLHEGFKYRQDYTHGLRTSWRCIRRHHGCKGCAVTKGNKLTKATEHTHDEEEVDSDEKS